MQRILCSVEVNWFHVYIVSPNETRSNLTNTPFDKHIPWSGVATITWPVDNSARIVWRLLPAFHERATRRNPFRVQTISPSRINSIGTSPRSVLIFVPATRQVHQGRTIVSMAEGETGTTSSTLNGSPAGHDCRRQQTLVPQNWRTSRINLQPATTRVFSIACDLRRFA